MSRASIMQRLFVTLWLAALAGNLAHAQTTPGAIPNPGTYQGSTQLQQEQDRQAQQYREQPGQSFPQQPQGAGPGAVTGPSGSGHRAPDCLDRIARRAELAPLAKKVDLAHPDEKSSALWGIRSLATDAERPVLLKWLEARHSCDAEAARVKDAATAAGVWTDKARKADDLSARITNDMIIQLANGKLTYGDFNRQGLERDRRRQDSLGQSISSSAVSGGGFASTAGECAHLTSAMRPRPIRVMERGSRNLA